MKNLIGYFSAPKHLALAIVLVSAVALSAAYISQYGFGLKPCILCLYQRVPYAANIVLGLLAYRYPRLLPLTAAVFIAGAGIAGFHAGVEYGWWKGLSSCGGDILPENVSLEELRKSLTQQAIVRCDVPAWTLFGISMAGYNFFVSLDLGLSTLYLLRKR